METGKLFAYCMTTVTWNRVCSKGICGVRAYIKGAIFAIDSASRCH
jgi:hypothetical protein